MTIDTQLLNALVTHSARPPDQDPEPFMVAAFCEYDQVTGQYNATWQKLNAQLKDAFPDGEWNPDEHWIKPVNMPSLVRNITTARHLGVVINDAKRAGTAYIRLNIVPKGGTP